MPAIQDVPVPYLKGHRLPCSDVAKQEGGSGLQKSDFFSPKEAKHRAFFHRKVLDL